MAKMLENPMIIDRPYRSHEPLYPIYKPDPICGCGCGRTIELVEYRTFEGEPLYDESCFMRIAYKEKWIIKEAV